jgi:hypothetical protein
VILRDARTAETISFARGGRVTVPIPRGDVQAIASDGARSTLFQSGARPIR